MPKDKTGLFKSAKDYENRKVNYNDDYNLFKNRRMVLIEIYKYGPYEKLKVKRLVENINSISEKIQNSNIEKANWVVLSSNAQEILNESLRSEFGALEDENIEENE
jgi:hypothetical protein